MKPTLSDTVRVVEDDVIIGRRRRRARVGL
jgi:hypothetical protein